MDIKSKVEHKKQTKIIDLYKKILCRRNYFWFTAERNTDIVGQIFFVSSKVVG